MVTRVGIIGTGFGVQAMVPGFRIAPRAEVVALCSGRKERAEAAAREHGIPQAYTDYREMLDKADLNLMSCARSRWRWT
jgi:predicted dehydrogenase